MKGVLRIWLGSSVRFFSSCSTLRPQEAWMWSHRNEVWWLLIWGGNCIATGRRRVDGEIIKNKTQGERELEWRRPGKSPSCLWEGRKVGNSVCRCACLSGVGHKACQITVWWGRGWQKVSTLPWELLCFHICDGKANNFMPHFEAPDAVGKVSDIK